MKRTMHIITAILLLLFGISLFFCLHTNSEAWKTVTISVGVTLYHFAMRLAVGFVVNQKFHNNVDYTVKWFEQKAFEPRLYRFFEIKKWKNHIPTYDNDAFNVKSRSLEEIIGAGCQAEIVHEIIMALSFVPMLMIPLFGAPTVFVITSILAAVFDSVFVILQRFNRPRLIKILNKARK